MTGKKGRRQPRVDVKWHVSIKTDNGRREGVTENISEKGAFVCCAKPLALNETFEMTIEPDQEDRELQVSAEVVWTNIYGPDDEITPRGMGVLFKNISNRDREFVSRTISEHLEAEGKEGQPDEDKV
jgi:c-di-GMP-binding flagellar brake protein YcgR